MFDIEQLVAGKPIWSDADEEIIQAPYCHLAQQPGKNFRSSLIKIFNTFYNLSDDYLNLVDKLVRILHTSSLLIDDIEDNSETRRGIQTSHLKYGIPMTMNSANYMYFKAMEVLQDISRVEPELSKEASQHSLLNDLMVIFNEELINLHRGQGLDIYWRDAFPDIIPDESMYFNMVMNKTGGLFRLTIKIMERLTCNRIHVSLVPLTNMLGILYQVRDDYQNLVDENMIKNKGFAEDISEGKLSFPIIHGIKFAMSTNDGDDLLNILKSRPTISATKEKAVDYLTNRSKSIEYTASTIKRISDLILNGHYIPNTNDETKVQVVSIIEQLSQT